MARDPRLIDEKNVIPWEITRLMEPDWVRYPKCPNHVKRAIRSYDSKLKFRWLPETARNIAMFWTPAQEVLYDAEGAEIRRYTPTPEFPRGGAWGLFRQCATTHGDQYVFVYNWKPVPDAFLQPHLILQWLRHTDLQRQRLNDQWKRDRAQAQVDAKHRKSAEIDDKYRYLRKQDRTAIMRDYAPAWGEKPHYPVGAGSHAPKLLNAQGGSLCPVVS